MRSFRELNLPVAIKDAQHVKICKETSYMSNDKAQDSQNISWHTTNWKKYAQINITVWQFQNKNNYMPKNALQNVHFSLPKHSWVLYQSLCE